MTPVLIALFVLIVLALLAPAALRLAFKPRRAPGALPSDLAIDAEDVAIASERGKRLAAWFIPPAAQPGPAVVVLHGWGSSASQLAPLAAPLHRAGLGVLLLDARCHGRSDDDDFASMPRFAEDLGHALDWLRARPQIDPARIAAIGHSVGGAAVILTASRRQDLAAAISVSAFAHPRAMMRRWLGAMRLPYVPLGWWVLRHVEKAIGHRFDDIAPTAVISRVPCPVLIVHGADDPQVPVADAHAIHAAGGAVSVELLIVDDLGHGEPGAVERITPQLIGFLDRPLRPVTF